MSTLVLAELLKTGSRKEIHMEGSLLLKVPEAATALALGRSSVYELIAAGELPVVRIGRAVRIPARAVREYVERLEAAQTARS